MGEISCCFTNPFAYVKGKMDLFTIRQLPSWNWLAGVWNGKLSKTRIPLMSEFLFKLLKITKKCSSAVIRHHPQAEHANAQAFDLRV